MRHGEYTQLHAEPLVGGASLLVSTIVRVALVGPFPQDLERVGGGVETSYVAVADALAELPDVEPHVITFARGRVVACGRS